MPSMMFVVKLFVRRQVTDIMPSMMFVCYFILYYIILHYIILYNIILYYITSVKIRVDLHAVIIFNFQNKQSTFANTTFQYIFFLQRMQGMTR